MATDTVLVGMLTGLILGILVVWSAYTQILQIKEAMRLSQRGKVYLGIAKLIIPFVLAFLWSISNYLNSPSLWSIPGFTITFILTVLAATIFALITITKSTSLSK